MAEETSEVLLEGLMANLASARRRVRQDAAHEIALRAHEDSEQMVPYIGQLVETLDQTEAQTRWEVLDVLTLLTESHADQVGDACEGAEAALFDETSSAVRLAAFRFLAAYGKTSPERSDAVWGLIDEAIQCYHGDPEYRDMLTCLLDFAHGSLSDATRATLADRMSFDANHGFSYIRAYSSDILKVVGEAAQGDGE